MRPHFPVNGFVLMDRVFWGVWLLFPVYVWVQISDILDQPAQIAALLPDSAACAGSLPQVVNFSTTGQIVFWGVFAVHVAFFAALLAMAHAVIHSCARGRMFVAPLIGTLRMIGLTVALYPVADLLLENVSLAIYAAVGDMAAFLPDFAFDVTVFGVGLLLVTIAMAMQHAMALQRDADLTI